MIYIRAAWAALFLLLVVDVINSRNGRTLFRQECQTSGTSRAPSPTSNVNMLFVCRGANSVRVRFFLFATLFDITRLYR